MNKAQLDEAAVVVAEQIREILNWVRADIMFAIKKGFIVISDTGNPNILIKHRGYGSFILSYDRKAENLNQTDLETRLVELYIQYSLWNPHG